MSCQSKQIKNYVMPRPKSPRLLTSEILNYPNLPILAFICAISAIVGICVSLLFTIHYWYPDNIVIFCLGFMPTLFLMAQIYCYVHNPLLPFHEQVNNSYSKSWSNTISHILVQP